MDQYWWVYCILDTQLLAQERRKVFSLDGSRKTVKKMDRMHGPTDADSDWSVTSKWIGGLGSLKSPWITGSLRNGQCLVLRRSNFLPLDIKKNSRNFWGHQHMGKESKETGTLRETLIVRLVQILPQGNPCMEYRCGIFILVWHVNVLFEIYHCMLWMTQKECQRIIQRIAFFVVLLRLQNCKMLEGLNWSISWHFRGVKHMTLISTLPE